MSTVETIAEPTSVPEPLPWAERHYRRQMEILDRYAVHIGKLRAFVDSNRDKLDGLSWDACHVYCEITIDATDKYNVAENIGARAIARRFPGRVFIKEPTPGQCGSLNWVSRGEGLIPITIRHAETFTLKTGGIVELNDETPAAN